MSTEQFAHERASSTSEIGPTPFDLEFTGERIVPGKTLTALFREHEERYVFAGRYVSGKKVLDVACGTGIGTEFLLKAGSTFCCGVDIDFRSIEYARAAYKGCIFLTGDASDIPLPSNSIDVVVSFETIEHVSDQRKFLSECRRVLRPRGSVICSTPNRAMYRWQGRNPFHLHEFTPGEFRELMGTYFCDLEMFAQTPLFYPAYILRQLATRMLGRLGLKQFVKKLLSQPAATSLRQFSEHGHLLQPLQPYRSSLFTKPMYLVAVARKPACS